MVLGPQGQKLFHLMKMRTHRAVGAGARRLARLSRGEDEIVETVSRRVVQARLAGAAAADVSLAEEVRDSAQQLASAADESQRGRWREMADTVGSAEDRAVVAMLGTVVSEYVRQIVGKFSPSMHRVVTAIAPSAIRVLPVPVAISNRNRSSPSLTALCIDWVASF